MKRSYFARRGEQLDALVRRSGGANTATHRAASALVFFAIERTADAIAESEAAALGLDEDTLVHALARRIEALREGSAGKSPGSGRARARQR